LSDEASGEARALYPADLATVRVESPPGDQLQIDFGQKRVLIAGDWVRVCLVVAVLSYSRRLFVKRFSVSGPIIVERQRMERVDSSLG
jgi:hypothetical protein